MMLLSTQAKPALESLQQLTWDQKKAQVKPVKAIFNQQDIKKCESMGVILPSSLKLKDSDVIISKVPAEIRGPLSFDISLQLQEISELGSDLTSWLSVQITHHDGSEQPIKIKMRDLNKWNVSCKPNRYGQLKIMVKMGDVVKVHKVEMQPESLAIGMKVVRGPDWEYGNQDGGAGGTGTVKAIGEGDGHRIIVEWSNGHCNGYRWGNHTRDLKVV